MNYAESLAKEINGLEDILATTVRLPCISIDGKIQNHRWIPRPGKTWMTMCKRCGKDEIELNRRPRRMVKHKKEELEIRIRRLKEIRGGIAS